MSDVSIIQQFLHPPVGLMTREVISGGPYSGYNSFQRVRGPVGVDAFGIGWDIEEVPDGYGSFGDPLAVIYDRQVLTMRVLHRLFDGSDAWTQAVFANEQNGYILFNESFPWLIRTLLSPGVTASFYWLLVL